MFYRREECEIFRTGFNFTKTTHGHGFGLMVPLPKTYKILIGYYWGLKFNFYYEVWSQAKADEIMRQI